MKFNTLNTLCLPAQIYLFIEVLIILGMTYQNWNNGDNTLCVGQYACNVESKVSIVLSKLIYVAFWTFILNLLCRGGYKKFAWFLVLLPLILFFILLATFMLSKGTTYIGYEGFDAMPVDRLNEINTTAGDESTQKKLKELGLGPGTIRPDYSYPDLSKSQQQEYNVMEGFSDRINIRNRRNRRKEGFLGMGSTPNRERRSNGSCGMGSVTGANLSGYPSQFDNDYYAQV
jgi:hypothetical protein